MSKENIAKIFNKAKRKIKLKHGKFLGLGVGGKAIYEKDIKDNHGFGSATEKEFKIRVELNEMLSRKKN